MRIISASIIIAMTSSLVGCTDPGETTTIGAATGGVLGAGLGAIVGSQTGSAGGGLVIGALAGSAAGGAVGNVLEGQERIVRTQDEAIERHERTIQAQRAELEELRRANQEVSPPSYHSSQPGLIPHGSLVPHASFGRTSPNPSITENRIARAIQDSPPTTSFRPVTPEFSQPAAPERAAADVVQETTIVDHSSDYQVQDDVQQNTAPSMLARSRAIQNTPFTSEAKPAPETMERVAPAGSNVGAMVAPAAETKSLNLGTAECVQAEGEVGKANGSAELADKLFHYRRALRLCPDNPAYHNGLGEIYLSLNRRNDAEFEFREALNLNPNFQPASNNLNSLR